MKELLFSIRKKDFTIQTFQSGGKGGQHQNKTDSGVRIIHNESKAVGESRTDKSQHRNKKLALKRLVETSKFKIWLRRKSSEITSGKTIHQIIDEQLNTDNLRVEIKDKNNKWVRE